MSRRSPSFDGLAGRVAAPAMARLNRDMESAAILELDPADAARVLSIGFGPGVGIAELARRTHGLVAGIDPSSTMVDVATRRNRSAVGAGRVILRQAGAEAVPWPDDSFDAAVAVNSMQLWRPLDEAVAEIARVLRPGGALVTVTYVWAVEKTAPLEVWTEDTSAILSQHCFEGVVTGTREFRTGPGLILRATSEFRPLLL
jgi:ubiquinone/menaquinone biosynthesis C-methylase UbiE